MTGTTGSRPAHLPPSRPRVPPPLVPQPPALQPVMLVRPWAYGFGEDLKCSQALLQIIQNSGLAWSQPWMNDQTGT